MIYDDGIWRLSKDVATAFPPAPFCHDKWLSAGIPGSNSKTINTTSFIPLLMLNRCRASCNFPSLLTSPKNKLSFHSLSWLQGGAKNPHFSMTSVVFEWPRPHAGLSSLTCAERGWFSSHFGPDIGKNRGACLTPTGFLHQCNSVTLIGHTPGLHQCETKLEFKSLAYLIDSNQWHKQAIVQPPTESVHAGDFTPMERPVLHCIYLEAQLNFVWVCYTTSWNLENNIELDL